MCVLELSCICVIEVSCICVLEVSILPLSTILIFDEIVPTVWYFLFLLSMLTNTLTMRFFEEEIHAMLG
jgi:hypothetical protein